MEPSRWQQIEAILQAALDRSPTEREAFLAEACAGDEALRQTVEALLAREASAEFFIESSVLKTVARELTEEDFSGRQFGRYRIVKPIGAGGMGKVYLADDQQLPRKVAIKFLPETFSTDADRVLRFEQEARAISTLNHPNILTIHEISEAAGKRFIVTEFIVGQTLRTLLNESHLPVIQTVDIAVQIAAALKAAHSEGITHHDLKPENIMVRADGFVKVLDFGVAKLNTKDEGGGMEMNRVNLLFIPHPSSLIPHPLFTKAGTIMGTASYMSPEQAAGLPVDERTDGYATGLVLYEMLTGQRVPRDEAELPQLGNGLKGIPADLAAIIRKALKFNREERHASAALLDDLRRVQERLRNARLRRRLMAATAAAVLLLVVALSSIWLARGEVWEERILRDGHTAGVRRAVFSPDEKLLVSVSEDHRVIVWDFAKRLPIKVLHDHTGWVVAVAFSPDGQYFATASWDHSVIVWDAHTLEKVKALQELGGPISGVAFSPDYKYLPTAIINSEHTVLWKFGTWEKVRELPLWSGDWSPLLFSPTKPQILYSNVASADVETAHIQMPLPWKDGMGGAPSFSPDGAMLLVVAGLGFVEFIDTKSEKEITVRQIHRDFGRGSAFSPDGKLAATGSEDIILWDAQTHQIITRWDYPSYVWSLAWSPKTGRYLVSTHGDGSILIWDIVGRERIANLNQHGQAVTTVAFTPDGKRVISASEDRSLIVWDAVTGRKAGVLQGHESSITDLAISPNSQWMASMDSYGTMIEWDWRSMSQQRVTAKIEYHGLAISPDGRLIANHFGIFERDSRAEIFRFANFIASHLAFSRDGRRLVSTGFGKKLQVWDATNWQRIGFTEIDDADAMSLSPDGTRIVIGNLKGQLTLWLTQPLQPLVTIPAHGARIKQVAFAPDGQTIVSVGDDKKLKLWQTHPLRWLRDIGEHSAPVLAVAFAPDGQQIACGGQDRSVRVYTRRQTWFGRRWD